MSSVPKSQYDDLQNRHVRMRQSRKREQRRCSKLEIRIVQLEAAVLAEREACAKICETALDLLQNSTFDGVAAAIRARK